MSITMYDWFLNLVERISRGIFTWTGPHFSCMARYKALFKSSTMDLVWFIEKVLLTAIIFTGFTGFNEVIIDCIFKNLSTIVLICL